MGKAPAPVLRLLACRCHCQLETLWYSLCAEVPPPPVKAC